MIDLIGKRRYGYLLSTVLVITSILFILGTFVPNANLGLQFSIAYTGGTVWEVHFEEGTPDPNDVRAVLADQGLSGEVAITSADEREYVLIRTEALLQEATLAEGSAAAAVAAEQAGASPAAEGAAASASPAGSEAPGATTAPDATTEPDATTAPAATAGSEATTAPEATAVPAATAAAEATAVPSSTAAAEATAAADASAEPLATTEPAATPGALGMLTPTESAAPDASAAPAAETEGPVGTGADVPTEGPLGALATALQDRFGPIDEVRQENSVGPVVSQELIWQTLTLILAAAVAIMLWVAYRFRDWRMGVTALVALLHDVIITVGAFALLGTVVGLEIDSLFVTAMLTVIGFSVHDTIVVFDRIRENRQRYLGEPLELIVNHSLVQTFGRSLTTSMTLIVTLVALLLFGGEAIRAFVLALLVGVVAGTYSSIFVATPLFLDWHLWADKRKADEPVKARAETLGA